MPTHRRPAAAATAWEDQADWYDARHGESGDRHHREVIIPALLRWLPLLPNTRILDCCCGQGVVGRALAAQGLEVLGIDAAPSLIASAQERAGERERYLLGDARQLRAVIGDERIDHAVLVLALQDLDPMDAVLSGIAELLPAGGRCLMVLTHPCFRIPRSSDWYWQGDRQCSRRVDRYLSPFELAIRTHPGADVSLETRHHHRPVSAYLNACGRAGLGVIGSEELCTPRRGSSGKRSAAEDQAAREFPMFLLLAAQRLR